MLIPSRGVTDQGQPYLLEKIGGYRLTINGLPQRYTERGLVRLNPKLIPESIPYHGKHPFYLLSVHGDLLASANYWGDIFEIEIWQRGDSGKWLSVSHFNLSEPEVFIPGGQSPEVVMAELAAVEEIRLGWKLWYKSYLASQREREPWSCD